MAKGNNKNNKLYKMLFEDYELEMNVDFWLHPQSGSYIISHNAVKKIVAKQHDRGFVIQTPLTKDVVVLKNGSEDGMHGNEVVLMGDFHLANSDGKRIRSVCRVGEANPKNLKSLAYSWTMAFKRMYDRGVLDLLQMAQEGAYSDIEADDFKKKPGQKPAPQKPTLQKSPEVAAAPRPKLPPPPEGMPKISAPEKKTPEVTSSSDDSVDYVLHLRILQLIGKSDEGASKTEIWDALDASKEEINTSIDQLMEETKIVKTGERRGTRYHTRNQELASTNEGIAPLTKIEYNDIWRDTSEELRAKGLEYNQIMGIVRDVTGHNSAIGAFKAGTLTKEQLDIIKEKGAQLGA